VFYASSIVTGGRNRFGLGVLSGGALQSDWFECEIPFPLAWNDIVPYGLIKRWAYGGNDCASTAPFSFLEDGVLTVPSIET
jgi:hypothetical protein